MWCFYLSPRAHVCVLNGSWAKQTIGIKAREDVDHVVGGTCWQLHVEEHCGGVEAIADGVEHLLLTEEQWMRIGGVNVVARNA